MATTFKSFLNNDVTSTRTLLHEAIPLTGSIVYGTYNEENIKNFSHGMFQAVYDYPYLSSSANHVFDLTVGYHADSGLSSSTTVQNSKKINIYNQMAQMLVGHDENGNIRKFDQDGDLTSGTKMESAFFVNFSRLLIKDEVKKGSFQLTMMVSGAYDDLGAGDNGDVTLYDTNAQNDYRVNSPAGEYGLLFTASTNNPGFDATAEAQGLIYYQAGIAVVTSSMFDYYYNAKDGATDIDLQPLIIAPTQPIYLVVK